MTSLTSTWTFNLSDTDPVFRYQPYADGQFENGWELGFTGVGLNPPDQDHNDGSGQSFHATSFPEASVSLSFFGVGISLFGQANCSYDVVLDGSIASTSAPPPSDTLFTKSNLDNTIHNVTLAPHPASSGQMLNFTGAQLTSLASSSPIAERIDNQNTSVISYSGSWTVHNAHQIPSSDHPAPYFQTDKSGSSASLNFTGRAVTVRGESNFGWWTYSADLDGTLYTMNASSTFIIPDALLFYQDGLDENITHTLTLMNTGGDGMLFALNSITVYRSNSTIGDPTSSTPSASASSRGLSSGALAGIVIGVVLALIALASSALLCVRMKRRRKGASVNRESIEPYEAPPMSEAHSTELLASRKDGISRRAERQDMVAPDQTAPVNGRKLPAIPDEPLSAIQSHVSSSIDPPSSSAIRPSRPSEQTDYNRLADAVVERIAMRFGPTDPNADGLPPRYSG